MLTKVISGGQTGSDAAGLIAAHAVGIPTGGTAPKGWRTEEGPDPSLVIYGLTEHPSDQYQGRTWLNVFDSDGTLRIAVDFNSSGARLTRNLCIDMQKPYMDVEVLPHAFGITTPIDDVVDWLIAKNIQVLNVAGNRESKCPGLELLASSYLTEVFLRLRKKG